jgi:hypothetical protein
VLQRATRMVPELFRSVPLPKQPHQRGAQTRHLVLEYVRAHPSELTPYLREPPRALPPHVATAHRQFEAESHRDRQSREAAADVAPIEERRRRRPPPR